MNSNEIRRFKKKSQLYKKSLNRIEDKDDCCFLLKQNRKLMGNGEKLTCFFYLNFFAIHDFKGN